MPQQTHLDKLTTEHMAMCEVWTDEQARADWFEDRAYLLARKLDNAECKDPVAQLDAEAGEDGAWQ